MTAARRPRRERSKRRAHVLDVPMALGFSFGASLLSAIPRSVTLPLARALGSTSWWLLPKRRRVAKENLACALEEMDERQRTRIARASFGHAAAIAVDLLTLRRVARDVGAHCEAAPGSLETLEQARSRGRGVILVAGHFGLFESMGIFLGAYGFPVTFVAKPFENPRLDAVINRMRTATGNAFIHKGGAKAKVRDILAAGGLVAVVVDQHVTRWDRLWIPFFGLDAATTRSLGTLAEETGAAVVPIHAYPAPGGRCRCAFGPILDAASSGDAEALVRGVIREMEVATRRMPEAWLWMHRRWKVRPDGSQGYPSYSRTESEERAFVEARDARLGSHDAGGE